MALRIGDLTAATALTPASDLLEFSQPTQSAPTSRKVTLSQLLALTLQPANNLSDIVSATAARTSLGLGSAATQASSAFDAAGAAAAAQAAAIAASTVYPQVGHFLHGSGITITAKTAIVAGDVVASAGDFNVVRHSAHQWSMAINAQFGTAATQTSNLIHYWLTWAGPGTYPLLDALVADVAANMPTALGLPGLITGASGSLPWLAYFHGLMSGFGAGLYGLDIYANSTGIVNWQAALPNFALSGLVGTA